MTTHDALLAAVIAAPNDDTVRLVYCDALEERDRPGDRERAEFIRVQVELEKLRKGGHGGRCPVILRMHEMLVMGGQMNPFCPKCDDVTGLEIREQELLDEHACQWFPPPLVACLSDTSTLFKNATPGMVAAHVTRGFVSKVACTLVAWCGTPGDTEPVVFANALGSVTYRRQLPGSPGIGPAVVRSHPVTRVVLTDREPAEDDDGCRWHWIVDRDNQRFVQPWAIPGDIVPESCLPPDHDYGDHWTWEFTSPEKAVDRLSRWAILWAKSQPHPARLTTSPVSVDMTAG
jgi:uncharacterized protein (TIGR02996 family)